MNPETAPEFVKVGPGSCDFNPKARAIRLGYQSRQDYTQTVVTGGTGAISAINTTINLEGGNSVLLGDVYGNARMTFTLTIADAHAVNDANIISAIGLQPLPLANMMPSANVILSNQSFVSYPRAYSRMLLETKSKEELSALSDCCSRIEHAEVIRATLHKKTVEEEPLLYAKHSDYSNSSFNNQVDYTTVVAGGTTSLTVTVRLRERLLIEPFTQITHTADDAQGFLGQTKLSINIPLEDVQNRVLAYTSQTALGAGFPAPTAISATWQMNEFSIDYAVVQPNLYTPTVFPYIDMDTHEYNITTSDHAVVLVAPTQNPILYNSPAIRPRSPLIIVRPNLSHIYVRVYQETEVPHTPAVNDFNFSILSATVTYRGRTHLSGCSQRQLYNIYKKNGGALPWHKWAGHATRSGVDMTSFAETLGAIIPTGTSAGGSSAGPMVTTAGAVTATNNLRCHSAGVLLLRPEVDLPSDSWTSTSNDNPTFQIEVAIQNNSNMVTTAPATSSSVRLEVMMVYSNRLLQTPEMKGGWIVENNIVTREIMDVAGENPIIYTDSLANMRGGSWMSWLKGIGKFASKLNKSGVTSDIPILGSVVKGVGSLSDALQGSGKRGGGIVRTGGGVIGGQQIGKLF